MLTWISVCHHLLFCWGLETVPGTVQNSREFQTFALLKPVSLILASKYVLWSMLERESRGTKSKLLCHWRNPQNHWLDTRKTRRKVTEACKRKDLPFSSSRVLEQKSIVDICKSNQNLWCYLALQPVKLAWWGSLEWQRQTFVYWFCKQTFQRCRRHSCSKSVRPTLSVASDCCPRQPERFELWSVVINVVIAISYILNVIDIFDISICRRVGMHYWVSSSSERVSKYWSKEPLHTGDSILKPIFAIWELKLTNSHQCYQSNS